MSDEWEFDEYHCPKCNAYPTRTMRCPQVGCDDGWIDMHEFDDPLLFDEGEEEICTECNGMGRLRWCGECGYNLTEDDVRAQETEPIP